MLKHNRNFWILATLFLVIIIDAMGMGLVYPILAPLFGQAGGMLPASLLAHSRDLWYGVTMAIYPICAFFGAPILGDLSDQLGRKKVLLICLYSESVAMLLSAIAVAFGSLALLICARAFAGLVAGNFSVAQAAIIDISDSNNKALNISLITLANVSGFVLGPMLGGLLADKNLISWFNYTTPFFIAAILAFINGSVLIVTFRDTFKGRMAKKIQPLKGLLMFVAAFANSNVRKIALIFLSMLLGWMLYVIFIPLYLVQIFSYSSSQVGWFVAWLAGLMGFALLFIMRILVKYLRIEHIVVVGIVAALIGATIFLDYSKAALWLGIIPASFGIGIAYAGCLTMFSNAADSTMQGWVMGVAIATASAASGLSALFSGVFAAVTIKLPFVVAVILLACALLFALRAQKSGGGAE